MGTSGKDPDRRRDHANRNPRFLTTRWSLVVQAREGTTASASQALSDLCTIYWYPLYAYVRRTGKGPHEAEDLTQQFFAQLLAHEYLASADREKGKLRTFLLTVLKRFMANEWDKIMAEKRGGGHAPIPIDHVVGEQRYGKEPADPVSPDIIYEQQWALSLLDRVFSDLRCEYQSSGKENLFDALKNYISRQSDDVPYADVAGRLDLSEGSVRVAVHRMRKRYRHRLRDAIADTVASPDEIDEEIRHLFCLFGRSG